MEQLTEREITKLWNIKRRFEEGELSENAPKRNTEEKRLRKRDKSE